MSDAAKMIAFAKMFGGGSSTPAPVVILPETEMTRIEVNGNVGFTGNPTLMANPEAGKTYAVTVNGTQYDIVAELVETGIGFVHPDEMFGIIIFNSEAAGEVGFSLGVEWYSEDAPDSFTLSIVEAAKTESAGGGVLVINVTCDADDEMKTFTNATKDKTYAEAKAVYDAGGIVNARLEYKSGPMLGAKIEFPLKTYTSFDEMAAFIFGIPDGLGANTINIVNDDSLVVMID